MALLIEIRAGRSAAARPVSAGLEADARRVSWLARYADMSAVGRGSGEGNRAEGRGGGWGGGRRRGRAGGEAAVGGAGLAGGPSVRPSSAKWWESGRLTTALQKSAPGGGRWRPTAPGGARWRPTAPGDGRRRPVMADGARRCPVSPTAPDGVKWRGFGGPSDGWL